MRVKSLAVLAVFVMAALSSVTASAQEPPVSRWWRIPKLAQQVNLTDLQKQQLDKLFDANRRTLRNLKDNVEDERLALEDLMGSDTLIEKSVLAQLARVSKSRSALEEATTKYFLEMRKILGAERFRQTLEISKLLRSVRKSRDFSERQ